MTRPLARRRRPHPRAAWHRPSPARFQGVRWAIVYEFTCRTHASELARLRGSTRPLVLEHGYDGQTIQKLEEREAQHVDEKPWADLIEGHAYVLWEGWATAAELDRIETKAIRTRKARYNIEQAIDLPWHVPKWVQYQQRWERDDAARRPRWVPPEERGLVRAAASQLDVYLAAFPAWMVKTALWGAAWALLTAMLGTALSGLSPRWGPLIAAVVVTAGLTRVITWRDPDRPRGPRRSRTRRP